MKKSDDNGIAAYNLSDRINSELKNRFGKKISIVKEKLSPFSADPKTKILVITLTSRVSLEILNTLPSLRAIVTATAGTDHIDVEECKKRGIEVRNSRTYSSNAVAELAIALAFTGLRNIERMLIFGRKLEYPKNVFYHIGSELSGRKCLVLGTGSIGSLIAKKLLALGCKVSAFSREKNKELMVLGVKYLPLAKGLRQSEILFISLPSTPETYHLIGEEQLTIMPNNSAIVNVARGELVDSNALLKHIDRLRFFASDVIEHEQLLWLRKTTDLPSLKSLVSRKNFFIVPHIGGSTEEAQRRLAKEVSLMLSELTDKYF